MLDEVVVLEVVAVSQVLLHLEELIGAHSVEISSLKLLIHDCRLVELVEVEDGASQVVRDQSLVHAVVQVVGALSGFLIDLFPHLLGSDPVRGMADKCLGGQRLYRGLFSCHFYFNIYNINIQFYFQR